MRLQFRTAADLRMPSDAQLAFIPRATWSALQQKHLCTLREYIDNPAHSQRCKMELLALSVLPLAQCAIFLGTPPAVAIGDAVELLEANFLQSALTETPALARWFDQ